MTALHCQGKEMGVQNCKWCSKKSRQHNSTLYIGEGVIMTAFSNGCYNSWTFRNVNNINVVFNWNRYLTPHEDTCKKYTTPISRTHLYYACVRSITSKHFGLKERPLNFQRQIFCFKARLSFRDFGFEEIFSLRYFAFEATLFYKKNWFRSKT